MQKYGGSSVSDAESIKRVARRIVDTRKGGDEVVVVVSAMGDTTDELRDLAKQVSPLPPGRELDMLLTAGERISMALVAMAIANLGQEARLQIFLPFGPEPVERDAELAPKRALDPDGRHAVHDLPDHFVAPLLPDVRPERVAEPIREILVWVVGQLLDRRDLSV